MANHEVKLIGVWESSYCRRVEIALNLKQIKYEFVAEVLRNKSDLLLKFNPVHKKVPVLVHNGQPIAESLVILEYIDETWKCSPCILPTDPYQKAMARFWAKFIDDKVLPAMWKCAHTQGEEQKEAIEEGVELLKKLEKGLNGAKFFGGESIGQVDIAASALALWVRVVDEIMGIEVLTKEKLPKLSEWADNCINCSTIKQSLPQRDELYTRLQAYFLRFK